MAQKYAISAVDPSLSSTRLRGRWLFVARLVWVLVTILSLGKTAIGLPLLFAEKGRLCTASAEVCSQGESLTTEQFQVLKSKGITLPEYVNIVAGVEVIVELIWFGTGLLIFLLRSNDWLALITSAMMTLFISSGFKSLIAEAYPGLAFPADLIFNLANVLLFLFVGLFPSGRFSPRWMRWYWLGIIAIFPLLPLLSLLTQKVSNLFITAFWLSFLVLGPFSQIYRYRNTSTSVERQQTKWVVFGFVSFAGLLIAVVANEKLPPSKLGQILSDNFLFDFAGLFIPVSVGISVLRYRLWDIDVIIRKTLVYSVVTGFLALVYFGGVLIFQRVFSGIGAGQSQAALVLSTLAIAALFNPLRRRVQAGVDRRFYRNKYNAEQTLASFAAVARNEVDVDQLSGALVRVVEDTVQPESVSLWLRKAEKKSIN